MEEHRVLNGRYRVEELIGRGGMADVFRGLDLRLNRTVAVKLMRADLARDPQFQARFRREARSAAALNHPAIVSVFDTGVVSEEDGQHHPVDCPFLVLEHVEGRTLREIVAEGDVTWEQAVAWTREILHALDHAHDLGIIHRDVKPANVMVSEAGDVKVMDFGIARALADTSASTSQPQTVVGTALYLPPEQATGGEVDARSDLYAVGCVLFELLTGRPPFTGDTPLAVAYQHVRHDPPAPSEVDPSLPPAFDAVVLRALAKDPDDRYSSGAEFLRALDAAAAAPDVAGPRPTARATPGAADASPLDRPDPGRDAAPSETVSLPVLATATVPLAPSTAPLTPPPAPAIARGAGGEPAPLTGGLGIVAGTAGHAVAGSALPGAPSAAQLAAAASVDARSPVTGSRPVVAARPATGQLPITPAPTPPAHRRPSRRRVLLGLAAALGGLLLLLGVLTLLLNALDRTATTVPEVRGMAEAQAVETLTQAGLRPVVDGAEDSSVPEGHVAGTEPGAGADIERGATVRVKVARAGTGILLPESLRGATEATARQELARLGLTVSSVEYHDTGGLARGQLVRTDPAIGTRAPAGSAVVLHLSSGMVRLPDLVGLTAAQARDVLRETGKDLTPRFQASAGGDPEAGVVVAQRPGPGARVDNRSSVTLETSATLPATTVPAEPSAVDDAPSDDGEAPPAEPSPVEPGPQEPAPAPAPEPTTAPAPAPTTSAAPEPAPVPTSQPAPTTAPPSSTAPVPVPVPTVQPTVAPTPDPEPTTDPVPDPGTPLPPPTGEPSIEPTPST